MLKINQDTNRLTADELEDYKVNSGITSLQYEIVKKRYYDKEQPTVTKICLDLHISEAKYNRELRKALNQIYRYEQSR